MGHYASRKKPGVERSTPGLIYTADRTITNYPCSSVFFSGLKEEPQRQLNIPAVTVLGDDPAEVRVGRIVDRATQVWGIQEVEDLRAELHFALPCQREVLEERNVPLLIPGISNQVARFVTELPVRRARECRRIEREVLVRGDAIDHAPRELTV